VSLTLSRPSNPVRFLSLALRAHLPLADLHGFTHPPT
jgi:hypothetical protein